MTVDKWVNLYYRAEELATDNYSGVAVGIYTFGSKAEAVRMAAENYLRTVKIQLEENTDEESN